MSGASFLDRAAQGRARQRRRSSRHTNSSDLRARPAALGGSPTVHALTPTGPARDNARIECPSSVLGPHRGGSTMTMRTDRRRFLQTAAAGGALTGLGELLCCNVRKGTFRDVEPDEENP